MGKRNKAQRESTANASTKSIGGFTDTWWLSGSGLTYQNADLSRNNSGAAMAYQTVVAVNRAIKLIGDAVLGVRWNLVRNETHDPANDEVIASSDDVRVRHALQDALIVYRRDYGLNLLRLITSDYFMYGSVYLERLRNVLGGGRGLRRLNPLGMTIYEEYGSGGRITGFTYSWGGESLISLTPLEVAYWHTFNPARDNYGLSGVITAIDEINVKRNLQRFLRAFFINDARPSFVMTPTEGNTWIDQDVVRVRELLQGNHKGVDNSSSGMILNKPVAIQALESPDVAKVYALDDQLTRSVYSAFGIPPAMAGSSGDVATYKEGDEVTTRFYQSVIIPYLKDLTEFVNLQVMPHFDASQDVRFEFDMTQFARVGNAELLQAQIAETLYRSGIAQLNEARQLVNLAPLPEGEKPAPQFQVQEIEPTVEPTEGAPIDESAKLARYADIDFKPTETMAQNAARALAWRDEFGRGGTEVGVARARDISNRRNLSPDTVRRMKAYFDRHQVDKQATGFTQGEDGFPSAGRIAYDLWGGEEGYSWAKQRVESMNAADERNRKEDEQPTAHKHEHEHHHDLDAMMEDTQWRPQLAYKEAQAYAAYVKAGKHLKRSFEPRYLTGDYGDRLQSALYQGKEAFFAEYGMVKAELSVNRLNRLKAQFDAVLVDDALLVDALLSEPFEDDNNLKSIADVRADWVERFNPVLDEIRAGGLDSRRRAGDIIRQLIRVFSYRAYREGLIDGGISEPTLDEDERAEVEAHIKAQSGFVSSFTDVLFNQDGITDAQAQQKARLWWNSSVQPLYYAGLESADRNALFQWTTSSAESCESCMYLEGQKHRLAQWRKRDLYPASPKLKCSMACKCSLRRAAGKPTGEFAGVPLAD